LTTDHLGSGDLILDSAGVVLARESFTPFGERRGSNWQGLPSAGDKSVFADVTRRGFTGHETLDAVSLIHMNGRVYDPHLGRFLSADPIIQTISLSQALNPFSYVMNNPLTLIDPSGYSWLSSLFHSIGHFLKKWGGLIIGVVLAFYGVPFLLNSLISSAFSTAVNGGTFGSFLVGFAVGLAAGVIAGPIGAKLGSFLGVTGQKLGAQIFMGALTGGIAGGISSVTMGGSFWSGFAGGALGGALSAAAMYGMQKLSGPQESQSAEQEPNSGGKGNPDSQFTKDANGNLVYSDEVSGPFSNNSDLTVTSDYHSSRDGGTTYHSGLDLAAPNGVTDANAISGNSGTVVRVGATGFGPNAVVIQTPKGNWVTYGHLASTTMKVGMSVSPGTVIGVIGNLGLSTGIHLHVQVTTGAMFGSQSRFLGVHGP
jgi:RHS repeat-associated protein